MTDTANTTPEIPEYISHKRVRALEIARVGYLGTDSTTDENDIVMVYFADTRFLPRRFNLRKLPTPAEGWYYVQYEDGYESFSPKEAFEQGYTKISDPTQSQTRVRTAFDMIARANTVTILSISEMEAIVNRALSGEFDGV